MINKLSDRNESPQNSGKVSIYTKIPTELSAKYVSDKKSENESLFPSKSPKYEVLKPKENNPRQSLLIKSRRTNWKSNVNEILTV
jgi:hypothetical protein